MGKALVSKDDPVAIQKLSDRMTALIAFQESDNNVTEMVLYSARCGGTLKQCASRAGLLPSELEQLFKWGEEGHPAWQDLFRRWLEVRGETMDEITESITLKAQSGSIEAAQVIMGKMNPEEWGPQEKVAASDGMTINLRTDFSGLYEDADEIVDAEVVE